MYGLLPFSKGEFMSHYFMNDENLKHNEKTTTAIIKNEKFTFLTDNGVFSKKGLDFGTRVLLETIDLSKIDGNVLDVGCGYGPIAIFIKKMTNAEITALDINERSLSLAKKNAELNKVNIDFLLSNGYENVEETYDYIITNPPIRVGKKVLYDLLFQAKNYLKENGELWLVIHKDQGAKSLAKDLEKEYTVEIKTREKGFYILCAKK